MKKIGNLLLILLGIAWTGIIIGYGVANSFSFNSLIESFVALGTGTLNHLLALVNPLSLGIRLYVYAGLTVLALVLGLISLIRLLKQRRLLKALIGFLSPLIIVVFGIAFVSPDYFSTGLPFYSYLLSILDTELITVLFLGSLTVIPVLFFGIVTLQGLFSKRPNLPRTVSRSRKVVIKKTTVEVPPPTITPVSTMVTQNNPVTSPIPLASGDLQLTELVKLVLAEELSGTRQPTYNSYPSAMDANLVRRIVAEELAKFQSHFITRAEAQTLVAQELATFKAQSKAK
jgi:hypothetical protein